MIEKFELIPKAKGGGSFIKQSPIFLNNGQYIFISWRNIIYCYNSKTGKRYLEYKGIDDEIVGFGIATIEECDYLYGCSSTGVIAAWKVENGLRVKKKDVFENKEIVGFKIIKDSNDAIILFRKKDRIGFLFLNLQDLTTKKIKTQIIVEDTFKWDIGGYVDDLYCCIIHKKVIHYVNLNETNPRFSKRMCNRNLTCVACHPENGWVLIGDDLGRVCLWYNLMENSPEHAVYHWHTLPVETISFSSSATHFYSGGGECVLVKWTIDRPQEKKFLPRLNNVIKQISVANDNLYIAFATIDNVINVIDSQFNFVSSVQNLVLSSNFESGIAFDPRSKSLVMNGVSGHLQFYSPHDMNLLFNLDIVGMNKLTQERNAQLINTEVTKIAIDRLGLWLATYEEYNDRKENCYESRLKFWIFNSARQTFVLSTSVEDPHNNKIASISFQPIKTSETKGRCVSVGQDKMFKIWEITEVEEIDKKRIYWHCVAAAYYKEFQPEALSFSFDGSLLAVTFNQILTTWAPSSCELKCSLVHPIYKDTLKACAFGTSTNSHLIVCASKSRLYVWNVLSLSLVWTVALKVKQLISDLLVPFMGVITRDNCLFIFEPSSPVPIYANNNMVAPERNIVSAVFSPSIFVGDNSKDWYYKAQLFFIDSSKELFCLETDKSEEIIQNQLLNNESFVTLFSQMMPQVRTKTLDKLQPVVHNYNKSNNTTLNDFLSGSAYSMSPMPLVCSSLLYTMIAENQKVDEDKKQEIINEKILYKSENVKDTNVNVHLNPACIALAF